MSDPKCETCKHWITQARVDDDHTIGECRLQMVGYGVFQGTMNTDSCLDWQEKQDEE